MKRKKASMFKRIRHAMFGPIGDESLASRKTKVDLEEAIAKAKAQRARVADAIARRTLIPQEQTETAA